MTTNASFSWLPSTARVVEVEGFGPLVRGAWPRQPGPMIWPVKDPNDVLDFVIDYSEALAGNISDAIATLDVSIAPNGPGDVTLASSSADGSQAVLWLSNGQVGTTYAVTVVISTNGGRSIARTINLPVAALATLSPPGSAITDQIGAPLKDQTGAVLTTK